MKKLLMFVLIMSLVTGIIAAQEETGYIKPTFSVGFASTNMEGYADTLTALGSDIDFVSVFGLTFGIQTIMAWSDNVSPDPFVAFGIGYTYTTNVWSIGGKLLAVPFGDGGVGLDVNGTYWFNNFIGLTGILGNYSSSGTIDWSLFGLRIGVSAKF